MSARIVVLAFASGAAVLGSCGASSGHQVTSGASPQAHAATCHPPGAHTVAADGQARVFTLGRSVYGCSERTGKRWRLGESLSCIGTERAGPFALAGDSAAYGVERCGIDTGFTQVVVRRLSDGRRLRSEAAIGGPLGPESYVTVMSLVVKSDGATAWIGNGYSLGTHQQTREVRRADRSGVATLDSGLAIAAGSLRVQGTKLTWKHGRVTRAASLQ